MLQCRVCIKVNSDQSQVYTKDYSPFSVCLIILSKLWLLAAAVKWPVILEWPKRDFTLEVCHV